MTELIVPRKTAYFAPQEGNLIKFSDNIPESLGQPLARVPNGPVTGLESGYRSGILGSDRLYKVKGSDRTLNRMAMNQKAHKHYRVRSMRLKGYSK